MPKAKSPATYLSDHESPEDAIAAAIADARSESAAARRFKRAYSPLVDSLKLPASIEDSDDAVAAARDAARDAVQALGTGDGDGEALEALTGLLDAYAEHTGINLMAALETLPDDATDAQVDALIGEQFAPLSTLKADAYTGKLSAAAAALGVPVETLAEITDGKPVTARTVTAEDGTEQTEWLMGEGEGAKALHTLRTVQAIRAPADAPAPKPPAPPLPTGGAGGKPAPSNPIQDRIKARQESQTAPTDPFKPGGNS